ncbi:hypothetical protein BH11PAT4_BH11PAT4_5370 [soil metagenome]
MSYCGYLGITLLRRTDGEPFTREVAEQIKRTCGVDVFLSQSQLNIATCILASKLASGVSFEEVQPHLGGVEVHATHYHGGLYNPSISCEVREFDELND